MDNRRYGTGDNELIFYEYLEKKYKNTNIDFIILNDDYALKFMLENGEHLFDSEIPLFFSGVNQEIDINNPYVGVYETTDIINTLTLMNEIHGKKSKIYIVSDQSSVNKNILANSFYDLNIEDNNIELILSNDIEFIKNKVNRIDDGVILYIAFHKDLNEKNYRFLESYNVIKDETNVPIYSVWDIYLDHGIVGGYLSKGSDQGELVAEYIQKIIEGTPYKNLKSTKNKALLMIDKKVADEKNINLSNVSEEIFFINAESQDVKSSKNSFNMLLMHLVIITLLIILVINILSKVYKYKRKLTKYINDIDEENRVNYELEKNVTTLVEKNKCLRKEIEISREAISELHRNESYSYIYKTIIDLNKEYFQNDYIRKNFEITNNETQYAKIWINIDEFVENIKELLGAEFKERKIKIFVSGQNKNILIAPGYLFEVFSDLARFPFTIPQKNYNEIIVEIEVFNEELKMLISELVCTDAETDNGNIDEERNFSSQRLEELSQDELVIVLRRQLIPKAFNDYMRTKFYGMVNYSTNRNGGRTCIIRIPINIK
jgi:hypothetical protein